MSWSTALAVQPRQNLHRQDFPVLLRMLLPMPLQMPLLFILSFREKDRLQQIYNLQATDWNCNSKIYFLFYLRPKQRFIQDGFTANIRENTRDHSPPPRWRPVRSRRNSAQNSIVDLRQLSENFREFERKNRRKSVTRFFNC